MFDLAEIMSLNADQVRGALYVVDHQFGVAMDNLDYSAARDWKAKHDLLLSVLVGKIQDEDPHTSEADIKFFEDIRDLHINA